MVCVSDSCLPVYKCTDNEATFVVGTNVDALQDAIITQAELLDIKADYSSSAEGRVIETKNEPGRGKLASVLVQRGEIIQHCYRT